MIPEPPDVQIPNARDENEPLGHGCHVKYPSTRLQDYATIQKLSLSTRSSAQSHFQVHHIPSPVEQILDDKGGIDTIEDVVTNTIVFPEPPDIQIPNTHDENEPLGRGCRVKYPSTQLQDYVMIQKLSPSTRSLAQSHFQVHHILSHIM